jgi:ectoine hydroxylase-related dioxygenase (phytanoyl-CoA dioxygenase family)
MSVTLTSRLDQAKADLDEYGYCLVEGALAPDRVAAIRSRLEAQADQEIADGSCWLDTGGANQRVFQLLNKGDEFVDLVQDPTAIELMSHLLCTPAQRTHLGAMELGTEFLLSSVIANIAGPGGYAQGLHSDQLFMPEPWTFSEVGNVMWMLDDFTEEVGATRVVSGSHRLGRNPTPEDGAAQSIAAEAPAGSAMVFDGRLWHGTGANVTEDRRRYGILAYYCRPYLRQQQNHFLTIRPDVLADATPLLRQLLGYVPYAGQGSIDGLPEEYRERGLRPTWREGSGR